MFYDLSPMRPDEFGRQRARRWMEAVQCRIAAEDGIAQAQSEAAGRAELAKEPAGRVG